MKPVGLILALGVTTMFLAALLAAGVYLRLRGVAWSPPDPLLGGLAVAALLGAIFFRPLALVFVALQVSLCLHAPPLYVVWAGAHGLLLLAAAVAAKQPILWRFAALAWPPFFLAAW